MSLSFNLKRVVASCFLLFIICGQGYGQSPKPKPAPASVKYGALAVDRANGFYYGWAHDHASRAEAEKRAVEECRKRGGNCSVVLSFSGTGCAAYRTIDGKVGTAYGWGVAKTQAEADAIARQEAAKRSNGAAAPNHVWACNAGSGPLKEIYNAKNEIPVLVKIGNQFWMNRNLDVTHFRNGDPVPHAKNDAEWSAAGKAGQPAWRYLEDKDANGKKFGKLYNWFAVMDPRGLAPEGYRIPSKSDWQTLFRNVGDEKTGGGRLKSKTGWEKNNGSDTYGFAALPGGNAGSTGGFYGIGGVANFWSSTHSRDKYVWYARLSSYDQSLDDVGEYPKTAGLYVRCLKE